MHDAAEPDVRPDDRRLRMPLEQRLHLRQIDRLGVLLRERHVDVVVQDHDEAGFGGELENAVERGVGQAGGFAGIFDETNSLWMLNSPMPVNTPGNMRQHAADVVDGVHVGRIESGDHRVEARLIVLRQGPVHARDVGVGERVVVERRVGLQVVGRREVAGVRVRPLLLQRDAEERRAPDARPHDVEEPADVDPLLNVVRQVEVRVVESLDARQIAAGAGFCWASGRDWLAAIARPARTGTAHRMILEVVISEEHRDSDRVGRPHWFSDVMPKRAADRRRTLAKLRFPAAAVGDPHARTVVAPRLAQQARRSFGGLYERDARRRVRRTLPASTWLR